MIAQRVQQLCDVVFAGHRGSPIMVIYIPWNAVWLCGSAIFRGS
jgi:hypothetical protein